MINALRRAIESVGGLGYLAAIAARTGFRLKGPYWRWRMHTAFGPSLGGVTTPGEKAGQEPLRPAEFFHALLTHARWVYRMRRHT